jgi:hypothetical protein
MLLPVLRQGLSGLNQALNQVRSSVSDRISHNATRITDHYGRSVLDGSQRLLTSTLQRLFASESKQARQQLIRSIESEINFDPHFDPNFAPLGVLLQRQDRDYPVIIERVPSAVAMDLLSGELLNDVERSLSRNSSEGESTRVFLLLRDLSGSAEGVCINYLRSRSLYCESDIKADRNRATAIKNVGLAFLIARLLFMKQNGYWQRRGEILYNFIPAVLRHYRAAAGLANGDIAQNFVDLGCEGVTVDEGESFLASTALTYIPLERPE